MGTKFSWVNIEPSSVDTGGIVNVTHVVDAYTGRDDRELRFKIQGKNGSSASATYKVIQAGIGGFIGAEDVTGIPATGGTATLTGTTNGKNFAVGIPSGLTPKSLTFNGESNWPDWGDVRLSQDYGATAPFSWSVSYEVPANTTGSKRTFRFDVRSSEISSSKLFSIEQLAGGEEPYITIDKTEVTLPASGGEATIRVESNVGWEITNI